MAPQQPEEPRHQFDTARFYRVAARWEDYTNYGILQDFRYSIGNIFPLEIDTWYFDNAYSPLGEMRLADMDALEASGGSDAWEPLDTGAFLARHLLAFEQAFAALVRLHTHALVGYKPVGNRIGGSAVDEPVDDLATLSRRLPDAIITGAIVRFDLLVAVRSPDGAVGELWLKNMGDLQVSGGISRIAAPTEGVDCDPRVLHPRASAGAGDAATRCRLAFPAG